MILWLRRLPTSSSEDKLPLDGTNDVDELEDDRRGSSVKSLLCREDTKASATGDWRLTADEDDSDDSSDGDGMDDLMIDDVDEDDDDFKSPSWEDEDDDETENEILRKLLLLSSIFLSSWSSDES